MRRLVFSQRIVRNHVEMSKRKIVSSSENQDFVEFLSELSNYERNITKNVYKANAYKKAASVLAQHEERITSGVQAKKLPGIGPKISEKIDEFIKTGSLKKIEKIRADDTTMAINQLIRITGIGPSKAEELVKSGIHSIKELRENKNLLQKSQIIGLEHYEEFEKRIPRDEMILLEEQIQSVCKDSEFTAKICGSFRRGAATCGDIDVLLRHNDYDSSKPKKNPYLEEFVNLLFSNDLITDRLSQGEVKFMGVCRLQKKGYIHRRIDIRLIATDQYYCALLYFTGSDLFNKQMRAHALEQNFTLNEYCLRRIGATGVAGEKIEITSEEDIFDYLMMKYKSAQERNA